MKPNKVHLLTFYLYNFDDNISKPIRSPSPCSYCLTVRDVRQFFCPLFCDKILMYTLPISPEPNCYATVAAGDYITRALKVCHQNEMTPVAVNLGFYLKKVTGCISKQPLD